MALRHSLFEGAVDLHPFTILQEGRISSPQPPLKITGRIIGASHFITFEIGKKIFHEIFACTDVNGSRQAIATCGPIGKISARVELILWNRIAYSFQSRILRYTDAKDWLLKMEHLAREFNNRQDFLSMGLQYDFPVKPEIDLHPKTILIGEFDLSTHRLSIITAHSYPDEHNVVKSISELKFL